MRREVAHAFLILFVMTLAGCATPRGTTVRDPSVKRVASSVATGLSAPAPGPPSIPLAPHPTKTSLTPDGRLMVDGRPFFFIGLAPGPPLDLQTPEGRDGWTELAEGGITMVRGRPVLNGDSPGPMKEAREYLDCAAAHGIYVCPFLGNVVKKDTEKSRARLAAILEAFKNHPAVFFWKFTDEPEWGKIPVAPLRSAYERTKRIDPDHLVWITQAPRGTTETLRPYNVACDVLATDIYPVSEPPGKNSRLSNKGLSMVGDYTRRMVAVAGGKKLVFMVLQVFWSGVNPKHNPANRMMFPTFRQERYMMYQAIINGANSVSFFGLPGGLLGRDKELGLNWTYWRAVLRPLLSEIKRGSELYPVLTAPDSRYPLRFTGAPRIEARWKEAGVYLYVFAAAREGPTRTVRFSGLQDGEVTVLFENRTLQAKDGAFTDTFAEHDVHIYRALRRLPGVPAPRNAE